MHQGARNAGLQWGHRLSAMEGRTLVVGVGVVKSRFNGAIAFQRWKVGNPTMDVTELKRLQWGHRLSAMEGWGVEVQARGAPH